VALLGFDHASGNMFRLALRGFPEWTERITFGLKPAVSVVALLLPALLIPHGGARWTRGLVLIVGLAVSLWLPGESAKIAALAGLAVALGALVMPRLIARVMAAGLALVMVIAPLAFAMALSYAPDLSRLPSSAAHRVLIWDFTITSIAERPILGWGLEASRSLPGSQQSFDEATLTRFGITSAEERAAFWPAALRLPLHPHNGALHIWLETGLVGAVLAAGLVAALALAAGGLATAPAALGALASGVVTGMLSFGIWQPWWIARVLLVVVAVSALARLPPEAAGRG
jgi:O-antigen ligase